jgi:transposase
VFRTHSQALDAVNVRMHQQPVPLPDGAMAVPVPPHALSLPAQQRAAERQARRQALHTQVWALHRQGWTAPAIAQQVGLSLRTVQRDLQTTTFPGRTRRSDCGDSALNAYKPSLLDPSLRRIGTLKGGNPVVTRLRC